jgi:hypothetical protein
VSTAEQLDWEARFSRPVAGAAIAAAVLLLASLVVRQSIFDDRPNIRAGPDALLSIDQAPGTLIAASSLQAVAGLLLAVVFLYLFRATVHRNPSIPQWFVYLIIGGPVIYAIAQLIGAFEQIDLAETFADQSFSFEDADPNESPNLTECPALRGELGEACSEELARDNPNSVALFVGLIGPVLLAFLFVMVPLRARRVGLLSPFMGILGVLAGVLLVLPILPPVILQAFWLGAIGALFLGHWPGGRGPAWETGEAQPWPTAAQRRGQAEPGAGERADEADDADAEPEATVEPQPEATVDPEPIPDRPSSRKRKRKRN